MRPAALGHIADDFQTRATEVFSIMIEQQKEGVEEDTKGPYMHNTSAEFIAVLRAARTLTF